MPGRFTLTALALVLAAPAFADDIQLVRAAGVEPGLYTLAELGAIASAPNDRDAARLRAFYAETPSADVMRAAPAMLLDDSGRHPGSDR